MKTAVPRKEIVRLGTTLVCAFVLVLTLTSINGWAGEPIPQERTLSNGEAVDFLTLCMLSDDAKDANTPAGAYACCSKSLGFCVKCPPSPADACTLHPSPASGQHPFVIEIIDPGVFAPTSPQPDRTNPRDSSMNAMRNFLQRNKTATEEDEKYETEDNDS